MEYPYARVESCGCGGEGGFDFEEGVEIVEQRVGGVDGKPPSRSECGTAGAEGLPMVGEAGLVGFDVVDG